MVFTLDLEGEASNVPLELRVSNPAGGRSPRLSYRRASLNQPTYSNCHLELGAGLPDAVADQLGLEGVDEAFGERVVVDHEGEEHDAFPAADIGQVGPIARPSVRTSVSGSISSPQPTWSSKAFVVCDSLAHIAVHHSMKSSGSRRMCTALNLAQPFVVSGARRNRGASRRLLSTRGRTAPGLQLTGSKGGDADQAADPLGTLGGQQQGSLSTRVTVRR